jgi:hypothetical protein
MMYILSHRHEKHGDQDYTLQNGGEAYEVVQITIKAFLDWELVQVVLGIPEA